MLSQIGLEADTISATFRARKCAKLEPKTGDAIGVSESGSLLETALPLDILPEKCRPTIKTGQCGKGRCVKLSYPTGRKIGVTCLTPRVEFAEVDYRDWETYFQLLSRTVLWASKRETGVQLKGAWPAEEKLQRTAEPANVVLRLTSRADKDVIVTATYHGPDYYQGIEKREQPVSLKKDQEAEVKFPFLNLCGGRHHAVDLIVRDPDGRSLAFATTTYEVISPVVLASLATEKEFYRRGDEAIIIAKIENKSQQRDAEMSISLTDMHGRIIAKLDKRVKIPAGQSEHKFALATGNSLTTLNRARLSVLDTKGLLLETDTYVYLPEANPAWDDYLVSTSHFHQIHNAYLRPYYTQVARDIGIEGMVVPPRYTFELLKQDVPLMYWLVAKYRAFGYNHRGTETSTARRPCLSDPAIRAKITAAYEELGSEVQRYGPLAIASLEDESELSGARFSNLEVCTSEHCTKRYHDWLKEKYKTIEALNAQWSTSHKSFDEIKQITYKEARKLENPAQWVDWRTFMEYVWLDALLLIRKGVKKNYPEVRMGFSNSFGPMPFSGWNYETLSRHVDMSIEYPSIICGIRPPKEEDAFEQDEVGSMRPVIRQKVDIRRSFMRDDCPMPGWMWYDRTQQGAEFKPWWMAFIVGSKGCTPWGSAALGVHKDRMHFWAYIHPLLAHTKGSKWLAASIYDLTHGVGKIFVDYKRIVSPVAVLYSQPSMHVAWVWSDVETAYNPETTSLYAWYYKSRVNITRMLRGLGFSYRYVGTSQIDSGELKNYRVLFLPCSLCLSDETLKGIQQFVAAGGVVVADIGTGAADQHGKPIAQRKPVEDLFAISRKQICRKVEPAGLKIAGTTDLEIPENLKLAGMDAVEPRAEAAATRENGAPAIVVHGIGKGKSIYLNGFLGYNMPSRLLIRNVLALAGVSTPIRITSSSGEEHMGYERATFKRGDIEILGILRLREKENPTQIKLGQKKHLYDVRGKQYFGLTDTARFDLTHKAAAVLAVMPYEITAMEAGASPEKLKQGEKVTIKARVLSAAKTAPGDHVLRMEVYDPSGELSRAYTDNVLAIAGRFEQTIQTALGDQPGRWRIVLTDVISGKKAEAVFHLGK